MDPKFEVLWFFAALVFYALDYLSFPVIPPRWSKLFVLGLFCATVPFFWSAFKTV